MVRTEAIAIIPARGGSKRIPRKNVIDFMGRPMIAWTIEAALESGRFDRVVVSTDNPEIAEISKGLGAAVPFLRQVHADDGAPVSLATIAALSQAEAEFGEPYRTVVQLMANCPLRNAADISHALSAFVVGKRQFQISCFRFGWMNPWWAVQLAADGTPRPLFPEARTARSQDLPPLYCPTGAIWIADVAALKAAGTFYGPGHRYEPISWVSALDIDDAEDLAMARALAVNREEVAGACQA
jgi:CMP-N-acetylneuraminic acid synthetase